MSKEDCPRNADSSESSEMDELDNHQGIPSSSSHQHQQIPVHKKTSLSVSSAPFVPRNSQSQQQEVKSTLSVSSPPFDPSWRRKLGRSFPRSTTTSTLSTTPQDPLFTRGDTAAMMTPSMYHHPMNTMPPPMPGYGMPMMGMHEQVNQAEPLSSQS